ncbi:MAG: hypothetical protein Q9178_000127 [Gyalolechia marmorata]
MADKTLMTVLTVSLAMQGAMPLPIAFLILGRDILLSLAAVYYRYISLPPPKTFARYWDFSLPSAEVHPTGISKVNTALQLGLIGWTMGTMAVGGDLGWWGPEVTRASEFTTITTTVAKNQKRENAATLTSTIDVQPQPYAYNYVQSMVSGADINASIASSVSSACSCLQITPKTVSAQSTIETTRTIRGSVGETQAAATVTIGTSTLTITETVHSDSSSLGDSSSTRDPLSASSVPSVRTPSFSPSGIALNGSYSTGTGSEPGSSDSTLSTSYVPINTTLPTSIPSAIPSSTTSSQLPVGTSINQIGCPGINNTIFTTVAGQQYQLQCYRVYSGATIIGLDRSYFRECIEQCSTVNAGFSAIGCYGVTWLQYDQGIHCNLKSQSALRNYTTSSLAVSAVLLSGVPPPVVGLFGGSRVGVVEAQQEEEEEVWGEGDAF